MGLGIKTRLVSFTRYLRANLFDMGGKSEEFWSKRTQNEGQKYAEDYWVSQSHPLRTYVSEAVLSVNGVKDILEVGCGAGANIAAILTRAPNVHIAGVDLDQDALDVAHSHFEQEGHNILLQKSSAEKLPFPDQSFDVIFTVAVLSCIGPQKIIPVLQEMKRVARRGFVFFEPHRTGEKFQGPKGQVECYPNTTYWLRDYRSLLQEIFKDTKMAFREIQMAEEAKMGHSQSGLIVLFEE